MRLKKVKSLWLVKFLKAKLVLINVSCFHTYNFLFSFEKNKLFQQTIIFKNVYQCLPCLDQLIINFTKSQNKYIKLYLSNLFAIVSNINRFLGYELSGKEQWFGCISTYQEWFQLSVVRCQSQ